MPLPGVSGSWNRELPLTLTLSRLGFPPPPRYWRERAQSVASELPLCGLHLLAIRIRSSHKTILNRFVRQSAPSVRKSTVGRGNIMRHCGLRPAIALPQHHVAAKFAETKSKRDFSPYLVFRNLGIENYPSLCPLPQGARENPSIPNEVKVR